MDLPELIEALSAPSAYPQPVETVDVHQTHISVVFLAGSFAYKVKKPVDLGFIDYATLERRRHFCEEEVRLNRRLAPEVYLGVVPVTREGGATRMEGTGEVVEWAVKMKRLPDAATLRAHLERGNVGAEALEELACRLARFHDAADSGDTVAEGGSFETIARNARENFEQSAAQVGVTLSKSTLDRLEVRTEAALADLRDIIEDRALRGIPRDTHGDLRLDHVYWFPERNPPGDWVIVDCIEFDERFRYADPMADVAFLAMDLGLHGRGDLAGSFVDAYIRASGDEEGRSLLSFYMAYRAAVRGKVEGMKLAQGEISEVQRSAAQTQARALWLFALAELEDPCRKTLPGASRRPARDREVDPGSRLGRAGRIRRDPLGRGPQGAGRPERSRFGCRRIRRRSLRAGLERADLCRVPAPRRGTHLRRETCTHRCELSRGSTAPSLPRGRQPLGDHGVPDPLPRRAGRDPQPARKSPGRCIRCRWDDL